MGQPEHRPRRIIPQGQNRTYAADLSGFLPAVLGLPRAVGRLSRAGDMRGQSRAEIAVLGARYEGVGGRTGGAELAATSPPPSLPLPLAAAKKNKKRKVS